MDSQMSGVWKVIQETGRSKAAHQKVTSRRSTNLYHVWKEVLQQIQSQNTHGRSSKSLWGDFPTHGSQG